MYSRIRRRTTCDGVWSSAAHSSSNSAFLRGSTRMVSRAVRCSMVVELGIALDVLVASLILGVFLFQIRSRFDSVDTRHLERLKEQ